MSDNNSFHIDSSGVNIDIPFFHFKFGTRKKSYLRTVPVVAISVIVYLLLGFLAAAWHPAWIIFFAIPLWYAIIHAVERRRMNGAIIAIAVVIIYAVLVLVWPKWDPHPTWLLILTVPAYYSVMRSVREVKRRRK